MERIFFMVKEKTEMGFRNLFTSYCNQFGWDMDDFGIFPSFKEIWFLFVKNSGISP